MRIDRPTGTATRSGRRAGAVPRHVAVIMDGNGRWATRRGLPRAVGHRAGARAVRRIVEAARRRGIATLTLFAFSADNWRRPAAEVEALMGLFERYLAREARRCAAERRPPAGDRPARPPRHSARPRDLAAEALTAHGEAMELRIAVDYSGRDAILEAVALLPPGIAADAGGRSSPRSGAPGRRLAGGGSPRADRRRAPDQRLPPLGERLRGGLLLGPALARRRGGGPGRGARLVFRARAAVRRPPVDRARDSRAVGSHRDEAVPRRVSFARRRPSIRTSGRGRRRRATPSS